MARKKKGRKKTNTRKLSQEEITYSQDKDGLNIHITINNTYVVRNNRFNIEQRAEGGGQINKDVGTNANQGGQNAIGRSRTRNVNSKFADGNGRSGIAGNNNDEAGGQPGIKVRESDVIDSRIRSGSAQSE